MLPWLNDVQEFNVLYYFSWNTATRMMRSVCSVTDWRILAKWPWIWSNRSHSSSYLQYYIKLKLFPVNVISVLLYGVVYRMWTPLLLKSSNLTTIYLFVGPSDYSGLEQNEEFSRREIVIPYNGTHYSRMADGWVVLELGVVKQYMRSTSCSENHHQ